MRDKEIVVKFPVYNYHVLFIRTDDILKSRIARNEEIGLDYEEKEGEYIDGLHTYNKNAESYIFLNHYPNVGTLAHECFHAISRMFRWIDSKKVDEEIFAYHLGYLIEKANEFYNEK